MDVVAELHRIIAADQASAIDAALRGEPSCFDIDGKFRPHHMGRPRSNPPNAFDGEALVAGMQAVCFLGTYLPAGDPLRRGVPRLYAKIVERLANPDLLLYGGCTPSAPAGDHGGLVVDRYAYYRPAQLVTPAQLEIAARSTELLYPNQTFPWSGLFHAWRVVGTPGVAALVARAADSPLAAGASELDPRHSVPQLVAAVQQARGLDEDAATLYLQLLALADCGDVMLRKLDGWSKARHDKAGAALVAARLVEDRKQPRANRKYVLPGTWEKLFAPHPAIERWKLELFGARMEGKALAAPLGRLVPLRPIHELFEAAWQRVAAADAPESNRPTIAVGRDWIAELRAAPDDDALRLVHADWLTEQGDPRGELISLQCRRAVLARQDLDMEALDAIRAAEEALLAKYGDVWAERIHPYVVSHRYDRGFITSITVHAPTFVKHAAAIVDALPLLEELQLSVGGVGPIPGSHLVALAGCEAFATIARLDFTPDHYLMSIDELATLLDAPHLPRLRWLRLGFHRAGEGFGKRGAELIARCDRLADLRFLEIAGQNLGVAGMKALLGSPHLARLEMLRVPYNGLTTAHAETLVALLAAGALPALRVLDVSNVVETDFVPAATAYHHNRVELPGQLEISRTLAARRGRAAAAQYATDVVPAQGGSAYTGVVLPQLGKYPFAERAKSARSRCAACQQPIAQGSVRIGIERVLEAVGRVTAWVHPACRANVPELVDLADLDARLTESSPNVWPPVD